GIEFLEYLTPRDGRPIPADLHANDLAHWQTRLMTSDGKHAAGALGKGRFAFVSPGLITLPESELGFRDGLLARDPDGHAMLLIAP
ncbi:MAG TPA: glyoxalase, partial [Candidatus Binatia bacterium]|nr:glyoxalase [Candidatus Binatia bacterium]